MVALVPPDYAYACNQRKCFHSKLLLSEKSAVRDCVKYFLLICFFQLFVSAALETICAMLTLSLYPCCVKGNVIGGFFMYFFRSSFFQKYFSLLLSRDFRLSERV